MERKTSKHRNDNNDNNTKIELASPIFNAQENIDIAEFIQYKTNNSADKLNNFYINNEGFSTPKKCADTNIIDLGRGGATYNIPIEHIPNYFSIIEECRLSGCIMHIQEKQTAAASGIMIDFDRYQISNLREITKEHFSKLSNYIVRLLQEFVDLSGLTNLHIFFIQKPKLAIVCSGAWSCSISNSVIELPQNSSMVNL